VKQHLKGLSLGLTEVEGSQELRPENLDRPTILLVPFFGGKTASLKKHGQWLNSQGFPVFILDLDFKAFGLNSKKIKELIFQLRPSNAIDSVARFLSHFNWASPKGGFGLVAVMADQIEQALNRIQGEKIIFAFSNPASAAIEAIARREAIDIKALICDSGPSGRLLESMQAYYSQVQPVPFLPLRFVVAGVSQYLWSPDFSRRLHNHLKKFPKAFPVLSIRGWKDPLIKPDEIDAVFEPHPQLNWSKLSLPQAKHLNGFKDFNSTYCRGVLEFLAAGGFASVEGQSHLVVEQSQDPAP
jgi:hypothetical protein